MSDVKGVPVPGATAAAVAEVVNSTDGPGPDDVSALRGVLANKQFLALWLAQVATQVGANMVLYGLTVLVYGATRSNSAVSLLILTFLVPAVIFSAVAGVYVDRLDRRLILVVTNVVRAIAFVAMFGVSEQLVLIYVLNVFVSTATTFFVPAEGAMIPILVERRLLLAANGLFAFTLQAAFALGFALLGPFLVKFAGVDVLLLTVAFLYLIAAVMCMTLPKYKPALAPSERGQGIGAARAIASAFAELRYGLRYIRSSASIFWSLTYLSITASLIGVLGVLGPDFATTALGLGGDDLVVVVLPLGAGIVIGILVLNVYGKYAPRRRVIEGGLLGLGVSLGVLAAAGPLSGALQRRLSPEIGNILSLLSIVVLVAIAMGIAYAFVAVPAQTQLQEELPEEVRGRVFGVLNMLVSISSFLPIVVVGPVADVVGTTNVILACAVLVVIAGIASILRAPPSPRTSAAPGSRTAPVDPVAVASVPLGHGRSQHPHEEHREHFSYGGPASRLATGPHSGPKAPPTSPKGEEPPPEGGSR